MKRRILSFVLAIAMLISLLPSFATVTFAYTEGYDGMGPVRITGGRRDFKWPVPGYHNLQSCFYDQRDHYAIDISANQGDSVIASYAGTVVATYSGCTHNYSKTYTCCNDGYGNYVVLKHTYKKMNGSTITLYSRYSHLTSVKVSVGSTVAQGATIGTIGSTGYSGGFHLDFQILYGGWSPRQTYSIDPFNNQLLELPSSLSIYDGWSCGTSYYSLIKDVYATALTCKITFNANGGSCSTASKSATYNKAVGTLPTPTRSGYTFKGWYTAASGGSKVTTSTVFTYDTTLYAQWTAASVNVKYYNADGSAWKTETATIGTSHTLSANYPSLSGSYFSGWAYTKDATLFEIRPGDSIQISGAVNLYPVFISHEQAISGEPVFIYNIEDFTDPTYDATATKVSVDREVDTSYWTNWSGYSTNAVTASETVEVRTTPLYRYYYYLCPYCNAHEPYSGTSDCGQQIPTTAFYTKWSTVAYSASSYKTFSYTSEKYYTTTLGDSQQWCFDSVNLNDTSVGTTNASGNTVITTGYSSRNYVKRSETTAVPTTAYILTSNLCGHEYTSVTTSATCQSYSTTTYTCTLCGDSYSEYTGTLTDWSTAAPEGVDASLVESKTQYRYCDYETKTSYETSLSGYTLKSSAWEQSGTGTVKYVSSWPSGFSTTSSNYTTYNKKSSKVTASETTTAKTVINSDAVIGYLYYHWCWDGSFYSYATKGGNANCTTFHSFYSTTKPSDCANYDASDGSYYFPNDNCCANSEWYWYVSVYAQKYTNYKKLFTYERWTDWSSWSETPVTASSTRKVETQTLYRYWDTQLGDHNYVNGSCTVCGAGCSHSYTSSVTTQPGCESTGVRTYTCSACGSSYTESVPATDHNYVDGICTNCGAFDPDYVLEYYLIGYINGADYGCESDSANMGEYQFVDGKVTATFTEDSYVFIKTTNNAKWYMTNGWLGTETTTATLYNTASGLAEANKLFVPGGVELTFTLVVNEDDTLTLSYVAADKPEIEKFDIPYSQMELGNALNLHFLFPVSACDDWTGAYAVITKSYADGRADVTVTVPAADWGAENYGVDYHDAAFTNIAAKEMTDEITIVVYNADGVAISNPRTDSIRNYLLRNLENYDSAELRALVVDMLNYGAAAQENFGYNTDDLANKDLTAEQKAFGTATMKTCTDKRVKGANFLGTGLELNNSIVLNMYFNGLTSDMTAKVTFTDHNNQPVTADAVIADGIVYVDQIVVADARQLVTVTVYDANGSVYGTATDSLESCVARASASDTIYQAIMKFADSAYNYLH